MTEELRTKTGVTLKVSLDSVHLFFYSPWYCIHLSTVAGVSCSACPYCKVIKEKPIFVFSALCRQENC